MRIAMAGTNHQAFEPNTTIGAVLDEFQKTAWASNFRVFVFVAHPTPPRLGSVKARI